MYTAGLWMMVTMAVLVLATGLPSWLLLLAVAGGFALVGVLAGSIDASVLTGVPLRLLGLLDNDVLQALPLYVLLGTLLNRLPLADTLFRALSRMLASTGSGAALAGLALGALQAPMNGSVGASVAMLTRAVQPRLAASGMPLPRNAALVAAASTLGVVVPPSLVLILLGDALMRAHTEALNRTGAAVRIINTQDVFRGALLPAAIVLALTALIAWRAGRRSRTRQAAPTDQGERSERRQRDERCELEATKLRPAVASGQTLSGSEWLTAIVAGGSLLVLLTAVASGRLYAVEGAATGGVVLFLYGAISGSLSRDVLQQVLRETIAVTGALFALLVGATVFTLVLRLYGTDRWIADLLADAHQSPAAVLAFVLAALALSALVLDAFEMIFVVIPVLAPPLLVRVPDAPWVAVLLLLILQISFLVPPLGYAVILVRNAMGRSLSMRAFARALAPYVLVQIATLLLVLAWPGLIWRGEQASVAASQRGSTPALNDEQTRELMRRELDEQDRERSGPTPEK